MKKLIFISVFSFFIVGCTIGGGTGGKTLSPDAVKIKIQKFLTDQGNKGVVQKIEEENGLYKITADFGNGQMASAYMTKDGKTLFPQAVNIDDAAKQQTQSKETQAQYQKDQLIKLDKQDKPEVNLFVMSYCPYGLQMEKGILPVVKTLGDKIDFKLRFVDYAMHEKKEVDENIQQYCIQKEQPDKFFAYLGCFADSGDAATCTTKVGVDAAKMGNCINKTDGQYKITETYNNKDAWGGGQYPPFPIDKDDNVKYGVQGSPSLVVNGTLLDGAARDSQDLMQTICAGFTTQPSECQTKMVAVAPSPGFGGVTPDTATDTGASDAGTSSSAQCK